MHVIRLLAPTLANEDHRRDLDFTPSGINARWRAGYDHTARFLEKAPWRMVEDPHEGFVLHEAVGGDLTGGEVPEA
jgi:NTE family protein